jgi:hypothetical protein
VLGPDAAENLSGTNAGFSDVPNTRWSAPYIAYAKAQKIIEGYGDGTFGPTNDLSRAAWLKMLLVSLGVDPDKNGLGDDPSWDVNAQALAVRTGLISAADLQLDWNRETAVYYAFLAMEKENDFAAKLVNDEDTLGVIKVDPYVPNLEKKPTDGDEFGRPGVKWTNGLNGKAEQIYATGIDTPVASYTAATKEADVVSDLGLKKGTTLDTAVITTIKTNGDTGVITDVVNGETVGANGTVVEFYLNEDEKTYTAVVIPTYVVELPKATKDADKNDVFVLEGSGDTALTIPADGFAKGDIVTYNKGVVKKETTALNVTKLEGTEGTITASNAKPSYVKVDGEKKEYAAAFSGSLAVSTSYTLYYDEYGYIIYSADPQVQGYDGYVYVVKTQAKNGNSAGDLIDAAVTDKVAAVAQIIDETGAVSIVDLSIAQDKTGAYYYTDENGNVTETEVKNEKEPTEVGEVRGYYLVDGKYVLGEANAANKGDVIPGSVITLTKDATTASGYTLTTSTKITKVTYKTVDGALTASATTTTGFATKDDATEANKALVVTNPNGSAKEIVYYVEGTTETTTTLAVYTGDGEEIAGIGATSKFLIDGEEVSLNLNGKITGTIANLSVYAVVYDENSSKLTSAEAVTTSDITINVLDDGYINGLKIADGALVYDATGKAVAVSSVADLAEKNVATIATNADGEIALVIVTAEEAE